MSARGVRAGGALAVILCAVLAGHAEADTEKCPLTIAVKEALAAPVDGWRAFDANGPGLYTFYGAMLSEGPPDDRVILTPAVLTHTKHERTEIYDVSAVALDHLWLTCLYRDTSVTLSKKLAGSFKECRLTYDPKTGFETVRQVNCRK